MRQQIRLGIVHVGRALREPEDFAERWRAGEVHYNAWVWMSLLATAVLGTATYGMTMGLLGGAGAVFSKGVICTFAAGMAWTLALPALYVLNSLSPIKSHGGLSSDRRATRASGAAWKTSGGCTSSASGCSTTCWQHWLGFANW